MNVIPSINKTRTGKKMNLSVTMINIILGSAVSNYFLLNILFLKKYFTIYLIIFVVNLIHKR